MSPCATDPTSQTEREERNQECLIGEGPSFRLTNETPRFCGCACEPIYGPAFFRPGFFLDSFFGGSG